MTMLVLQQIRPLMLRFSIVICGVLAGPLVRRGRWHFPCAWVKVEVTAQSRLAVLLLRVLGAVLFCSNGCDFDHIVELVV